MEAMNKAAQEGDVSSLKNLLEQDPLLLHRLSAGCHVDTPLHIASMLGHADFVKEIISRKPELSTQHDAGGSLAIHLATAEGYLNIVKMLVSSNPDTCTYCNGDGRNPFHIAVIKGHIDILKELIKTTPNGARMTTSRNETILHLCVRCNQLQVLTFMMASIDDRDREFLNSKDEDGNNVMHLAVLEKRISF